MQIYSLTVSTINDLLRCKAVAIMLSGNALNDISCLNGLDSWILEQAF